MGISLAGQLSGTVGVWERWFGGPNRKQYDEHLATVQLEVEEAKANLIVGTVPLANRLV